MGYWVDGDFPFCSACLRAAPLQHKTRFCPYCGSENENDEKKTLDKREKVIKALRTCAVGGKNACKEKCPYFNNFNIKQCFNKVLLDAADLLEEE